VTVDFADTNLVALPAQIDSVTAASLGCRFATAFRGVTVQGRARPGQWVAVHGCGGLGLSAIMIAAAAGARLVAVDVLPAALDLARDCGAEILIRAGDGSSVVEPIVEATDGGAHLSFDALGHPTTCSNSIRCLRRGGTHVQLGLLLGDHLAPPIPMDRVIAHELRIVGSHGMAAHAYPELLRLIVSGRLNPGRLISRRVTLEEGAELLTRMDHSDRPGITVIDLQTTEGTGRSARFWH
jgi:alcohol dehydrogenase